jgi:rod shape determining protein RodA
MRRFRFIGVGDPLLFALVVGLAAFGIVMVYSAGVLDVPSTIVAGLWRQQLLWFVLALVAMPLVMRVPVVWLEWAAKPFYVVSLVLLVAALVVGSGAGTAASMSGWLRIGPINIQPAELAKVGVIMMLARMLAGWREAPNSIWMLGKPIAVVAVPMGLVMLQPDLGTALVFGSILLVSLFWAGTPLPFLVLLVSPAIGLFLSINTWLWGAWIVLLTVFLFYYKPFLSESVTVLLANVAAGTIALPLWNSLAEYQRNRFLVFLDPSIDPRGAGYNLIQSQVAIGSGGLYGKGFTFGTQKRLAFLPEQHTDFIFAVVGEELGFVFGIMPVLLVFGLIFWRLVRIAEKAADPFASLIPFALFGSWFAHVLVNTGMTVGLMPITGIPLPFLSYGGSFLLVNMLAMAMVLRIAAEARGGEKQRF